MWLVCSSFIRHDATVRKPAHAESLYLDFDGFFASCEEQHNPRLRGLPVGVIPFAEARHSCVIAANAKAKRFGVKTGVAISEARRLCPDIALVPQQPDLYVSVHQRIVAAVLDVLPVDVICSIDELAASLGERDSPAAVARQVKLRVREAVGAGITCSIGCAPNRWLAKIAADMNKPNGLTVLQPNDLPGRLLDLDLEDLPGVAKHMRARLSRFGIVSVGDLWQSDPIRLRDAWGNVTGARLWYALHGYAVQPPPTRRSSIGHGRVLPPGERSARAARPLVRQLVVKAARRLRREGWLAQRLSLWVASLDAPPWSGSTALSGANDDRAALGALAGLWERLVASRPNAVLFRVGVLFDRFLPAGTEQLSLSFAEPEDRRGLALSSAMDAINGRYRRTVVGYGNCGSPGGYTGAKIAYGRIPELEDFQ